MLHREKVIIVQHRISDETTETTQVRELLGPVDLRNAVVTGDAAHACRDTVQYIAGKEEESNHFLFVKGNQPSLQRAAFDAGGQLISKEIVHAVASLSHDDAGAASLAKIARGQWGIESVHWTRDTASAEDASSGYAGNGPQIMATLRDLAVSLL